MAELHGKKADLPLTSKSSGRRWLYPLLLSVQTVGVVLLYWVALPIYRKIAVDPTAYHPQTATLLWGSGAAALIQIAYWIGYRMRPAPPRFVNVVLGHILLFVSELSFVFVAAIFSYLFISRSLGNQMSIPTYIVTFIGLFSLFCYFLELERFGRRLLAHKQDEKKNA